MAVPPTDANVAYAGTFGSENDAGKTMMGRGLGVVRSMNALANPNTAVTWETINKGLCPNGTLPLGDCTANDPAWGSLSLFVGTVAIDPNGQYVYIATLNGLYRRLVSAGPTVGWTNITRSIANPRFEAIAVDPNNSNTLYAGTSELADAANPTQPPAARIFKSVDGGTNWTEMMPAITMEPLAWSDRYRVRDIQVRKDALAGQPKVYAVIEGSAIYVLNQ